MTKMIPVLPRPLAGKRWLPARGYAHAATQEVALITAQEMPSAALQQPLAFVRGGPVPMPVAVYGLEPGRNLHVGDDGAWLGGYVAEVWRHAPFGIGRDEQGRAMLCVDEDSPLVGDVGEPFHDDQGHLAAAVQALLEPLRRHEAARRATIAACTVLDRHHLIKPWQILIKTGSGERPVKGLWCIDQERLNQLPAAELTEVRDAGGLPIVYCQLLSMSHLKTLGRVANAAAMAARAGSKLVAEGEIDIEFLNKGGTLDLSGL